MVVWPNGTFGAGKTTTATEPVAVLLGARIFDAADDDTLRGRIETDTVESGARQWRLDHLPPYRAALPWLRAAADTVVDTAGSDPRGVAAWIAAAVTG